MDALAALRADARVLVRRPGDPDPAGRCVVLWVQRSHRAVDNPALDLAIEAGNALGLPVVAFLGVVPFYPHANLRHYRFLADGIADLAAGLAARRVGLVLRPYPDHHLPRFADEVRAALVVGDENPLREPERWRAVMAERLRVPLWTVDADVVVPSRLLAKEQFAAYTMRPRVHKLLDRFLVAGSEPVARCVFEPPAGLPSVAPERDWLAGFPVDRSTAPVDGIRGGTTAAMRALERFVRGPLATYDTLRNHPEHQGTSQLSPYLHFGHLGPRAVALAVQRAEAPGEAKAAYLEELIVRRELAINYCRYNPRYDSLEGCEPWALTTLREHEGDPRPGHVDPARMEAGESHDPLWNAAQRQMVDLGWMHNYMRMYWAKKILEWSPSPAAAFALAVRLNDRYLLDGRDPNGYAGVAWAIGGKHDRAWGERPIFGKIRFMSFASTSKKFDSKAYIARWAPGQGQAQRTLSFTS